MYSLYWNGHINRHNAGIDTIKCYEIYSITHHGLDFEHCVVVSMLQEEPLTDFHYFGSITDLNQRYEIGME